jgi:hypothetical protein
MLRPSLEALGIQHVTLAGLPEVDRTVRAAADLAFGTRFPAALILSKLLTGWGA